MKNIDKRMVFGDNVSSHPLKGNQSVLIECKLVGWLISDGRNMLEPIKEKFVSIPMKLKELSSLRKSLKQNTEIEESEDNGYYHLTIKLRDNQHYLDLYQIANRIWKLI
jgi:hypothetical protein